MENIFMAIIFLLLMVYLVWRTFRKIGGGRSYKELLDTDEWRRKRQRILKRDNHVCKWCGRSDHLQVHHKYYEKYPDNTFAEPWDYPDTALITLCESCHRKYHEKYHVGVYYRKYGKHYG